MTSWLKPYARTWYRAYPSAAVPFRQLAHYIKPLTKAHPEDRIVAELTAYLAQTPARYLSLAKFAQAFGAWNRPAPTVRGPYYQTPDEMDRKAGILP